MGFDLLSLFWSFEYFWGKEEYLFVIFWCIRGW